MRVEGASALSVGTQYMLCGNSVRFTLWNHKITSRRDADISYNDGDFEENVPIRHLLRQVY